MPSADTVSATLTGYTEIMGGAPFRNISMQGTMGVNPGKPPTNSVFNEGGPLVRAVLAQARAIVSSANLAFADAPRLKNEYDGTQGIAPNAAPFTDTGFLKWHQLRQFLEGYMELKKMVKIPAKDAAGMPIMADMQGINPKDIRLAFCSWKDESVYLCTLRQADMRKSANNPLEYQYTINLQAYKRIKLDLNGETMSDRVTTVPIPNPVSQVLNRLQAARDIIRRTKRLLNTGLLGPLSIIGEVARQMIGIVKDGVGFARSVAEMPATFAQKCIGVLRETRNGALGIYAEAQKFQNISKLYEGLDDEFKEAMGILEPSVGLSVAIASRSAVESPQSRGQVGNPSQTGTSDPTAPDPRDYPSFADLDASVLAATEELRQQLQAEIERSQQYTLSEIEDLRDQLRQSSDYFSTLIGSWSQTYQDTYDLPTPNVEQRTPTQEELDVLYAINELTLATDKFVVYMQDQGNKIQPVPTSLEYVAGLAQASGIAFVVPTAKFAVPFPYGATLEGMAAQYLGDPNRWHEIATLNGLRAPYVDEEGFVLPLLVNGNGNTVSVNDTTNLFLKQTVWISSRNHSRTKRSILAINKFGPNNFILTLDGDDDLSLYTTEFDAKLESFTPGTVNSRQSIYLPTDAAPNDPEDVESIPGVDIFDPLLRVAGVDWLLNDKMDLVITDYGDNPLSFGLRNVVQTLLIGFATPKGSLKQHPNWGVGIRVGKSVADINVADIVDSARGFIESDSTFSGLNSASVTQRGNSMFLNVDVSIAGTQKSVPVRFPLKS